MKRDETAEDVIRTKFQALRAVLDERGRRLWAATESRAHGYGGDSVVSRATGLTRATIRQGRVELEAGLTARGRIRKVGGGRPKVTKSNPGLLEALDRLVDPITRGNPESPLRWTTKSRDHLAEALQAQGFAVSASTVRRLLLEQGYRMQTVSKSLERRHHDDRDAQFLHINGAVRDYQASGDPAISVDTKKKELVGDFKNGGREWHPAGQPPEALSHDFPQDSTGKAVPYGVFDMKRNEGFVNVGTSHDTSAFAVESIRQWWTLMGRETYPNSKRLLITADCGGSNGYRIRAWKAELQALANETGLTIDVLHFPPGTSKWNKVEHRLFSYISINWRGRPLDTFRTIVELIGATSTKGGLKVKAVLDQKHYNLGASVSDGEMARLNITRSSWHGEWNYTIAPVAC
jgi:hypothetical protein